MKSICIALAICLLAGCKTAPVKSAATQPAPSLFTRIGQTNEHTATAIRVGYQAVVSGMSLFRVKLSATGSIEFDLVAFDNRSPFPSETVGVAK